jgi:hypothetical protein
MAGFLYRKIGSLKNNRLTLEEVRAMGLGYAFSKEPTTRETTIEGKKGFVFADEKRLGECTLGVYPNEQVWRKIPGREDGLEIGYYKEAVPTPEDLKRDATLDGYVVDLAGKKWTVPLVRSYDGQAGVSRSALPCYVDLDEEGKPCQGEVLEVYKYLWDLTESYAASVLSNEESAEDVNAFEAAVKLLQANYVIDQIEAVQLRLFSDLAPTTTVLLVAIDYGTFLEWMQEHEKKSNPGGEGGSNSSAGEAA